MKVVIVNNHHFDQSFLEKTNEARGHTLHWFEAHLNTQMAPLAAAFSAVSCFVTDDLTQAVLEQLN
ncbi:MAG: hypothetical protein JHC61_14300 [Burkholderiaceae bacterium]|nr:hypothetical protein [Burkholderiaceae bacterium]